MRRAFQVTLAILSLLPFGFGLTNLVLGAARYMPADQITAPIDSQFRFESAIYMSVGVMLWWVIPRFETKVTPLRIIALGIFVGGIGRAVSYSQYGAPLPPMIGGMYFEFSMPLLLLWHWWLVRQTDGASEYQAGTSSAL